MQKFNNKRAMIKTGIYGGSFNPVHNGHIALAHELRQLAGLDEIWFVVSPQNPLKTQASLLDDRKRLDMTRRALEPYPELVASNYEFALPRPSYMWHTRSLRREQPLKDIEQRSQIYAGLPPGLHPLVWSQRMACLHGWHD